MQLLAVARGGTLHQHLPDIEGVSHPWLEAVHRDQHGESKSHRIQIAPNSLLARWTASRELVTNSRHHQAVDRPGRGLVVSATAPDGVIEAIEQADLILVAPSNPVVSIGPILATPGLRDAIQRAAAPVVDRSARECMTATKGQRKGPRV